MLENKIETCKIRWRRHHSTGKAFRNNCNLKIASCCNLKGSWVGCFFFGRHEKTWEWGRTISLCFHSTCLDLSCKTWKFGVTLSRQLWLWKRILEALKLWMAWRFPERCTEAKELLPMALPLVSLCKPEVAFSIFPTSPCIQDLKYPLHLMFCDHVGMATVQNTLAFTGLPTGCRVNCKPACCLQTEDNGGLHTFCVNSWVTSESYETDSEFDLITADADMVWDHFAGRWGDCILSRPITSKGVGDSQYFFCMKERSKIGDTFLV